MQKDMKHKIYDSVVQSEQDDHRNCLKLVKRREK